MTKVRKKHKIFRALVSIILILGLLAGTVLTGYILLLKFKGIENVYRIMGFAIAIYLFLFLSYLLLRSIKRKGKFCFIFPLIISLLIIGVELFVCNIIRVKIKEWDDLENKPNLKTTALVTYKKELKDNIKSDKDVTKVITNMKIGIVNDKESIEEYILPQEVITELNLTKTNKLVEYDSPLDLVTALKEKKIDVGFLSGGYVDTFYSFEGFDTIADDSVILYEKTKEYPKEKEEDIKSKDASLNKPFNMLLIGVDSTRDGNTYDYNADVIILATFNPKMLKVTLTSVPRDMYMKTACSNGHYRKINTTTWGSSANCIVKTVENLFDVDIDYYAKVNFKGVVKIVDALEGIDVDVPYAFCEQNSSRKWGKKTVYVEKGMQHLNGEQALALARNRKTNKHCPKLTEGNRNDYTRGKNEMKVVLGIVNAGIKVKDPSTFNEVLKVVGNNLQTNVKIKDILTLYDLGKSIMVSDKTNLVNVQRMQLKGYSAAGWLYDPYHGKNGGYSTSDTIPYNGSINDIKKAIKANLNNSKITPVKKISFNINKEYKTTIIGQGNYSQARIPTLANVSSYSVSKIKSYASSNGLKLKFIDKSTGQQVNIDSWGEYTFSSQKEHKDTILDQISTLTIYVKKKVVQQTQPEETGETSTQGGQ